MLIFKDNINPMINECYFRWPVTGLKFKKIHIKLNCLPESKTSEEPPECTWLHESS